MFITPYFTDTTDGTSFSRQQACNFAKQVADDFNPLHDADAKRFCVPGDLLFSVVLSKAGLSQQMDFNFSGMVGNDIILAFPTHIEEHFTVVDKNQKAYLDIKANGDTTKNSELIESLIKAYVAFSGQTFPHILVRLMAENNVMINPTRPMVMYESMSITLDTLDISSVELALSTTTLEIDGKRGKAKLQFDFISNGTIVGHGQKNMMLSGLREYCADVMSTLVDDYAEGKAKYLANK
jgi:hypothetical protein